MFYSGIAITKISKKKMRQQSWWWLIDFSNDAIIKDHNFCTAPKRFWVHFIQSRFFAMLRIYQHFVIKDAVPLKEYYCS